jgi:hypothetical protein
MKCSHHQLYLAPSGYGVGCRRCNHLWSVHSKDKRVVKFVKENKIDLTKVPQLMPQFQPK